MTNSFIKCTLQLEGIVLLKSALERVMAIKVIQENSFTKRKDERNDFRREKVKNKFINKNNKNSHNNKENKVKKI